MPRLRDLGLAIGRLPTGPLNAITDIAGVRVGHTTIVEGRARTGVTAIHPHGGSALRQQVPAAIAVLNGAGEITGRSLVDEYGTLESPILLTSTASVGVAHRAAVEWLAARDDLSEDFVLPIVSETWDGFLSDPIGEPVTKEHVWAALDSASGGVVAEGNVGGGTGMALFGFKGGIGTSSRRISLGPDHTYTVAALVQGNYGQRPHLRIDGHPVGLAITDLLPKRFSPEPAREGSVVVVLATDAPLSDRQLGRLCRRGMLGIGRTGGIAGHTSGDLLIAFSNHPEVLVPRPPPRQRREGFPVLLRGPRVHDAYLDPLFEAAIEATEEAVINAMIAATTMEGRDGNTLYALPHDRLLAAVGRRG